MVFFGGKPWKERKEWEKGREGRMEGKKEGRGERRKEKTRRKEGKKQHENLCRPEQTEETHHGGGHVHAWPQDMRTPFWRRGRLGTGLS